MDHPNGDWSYAVGAATPLVSVLQAGSAVLVDPTGLPVVRCACGNPLSAPPAMDLPTASLQGNAWDGYDPNRAVVVTAGPTATEFVVVDVDSGQDLTLTVGAPATATPVSSTAGTPTASAATTSDGPDCMLDLTWPVAARGWIESLDGTFTCQEMIDQWRRNEQWPGSRGGTMQLVDFPDGWYCSGVHWDPNGPPTDAVGDCDLDGRRFNVYQGEPGRRTPAGDATPTPSSGPDTITAGPPSGAADLLVTPSRNIVCARRDGQFACTIKQFDFDLGDERCDGARGPIVRLDANGSSDATSCRGDFFDIAGWPDPTPYGTTAKLGDISCDVEQSGLTCTNLAGHGFTLARAGITPF